MDYPTVPSPQVRALRMKTISRNLPCGCKYAGRFLSDEGLKQKRRRHKIAVARTKLCSSQKQAGSRNLLQ